MFRLKNSVAILLVSLALSILAPQALRAQIVNPNAPVRTVRRFYITQNQYSGRQALTACAAGYHMASLWEIFDFSSLRYDTALGFTAPDSGFGPPFISGWIRTGFFGTGSPTPGNGNCNAWTSDNNMDQGTIVEIGQFNWASPATSVSPWSAESRPCDAPISVWCVQD